MKAFVFTAGFGTRLHPITHHIPKPAIPLLNIPIVFYAIQPLLMAKIHNMVFNLHHLSDKMAKTLNKIKDRVALELIQESPKPLGSAGGIAHARFALEQEDDFFVVNGDSVFLPENPEFLKATSAFHKKHKALATLVLTDIPSQREHNLVWFCKNTYQVKAFTPHITSSIDLVGRHLTGHYLLSQRIFKYLHHGEHIFKDVLSKAIKQGEKVMCFEEKGHWFEVGNSSDFLKATTSLLELRSTNKYFQNMLSKYLILKKEPDFKNTSISKNTLIGNHVRIGDGCVIGDHCVLGDRVCLGTDVHLQNTVVLPDCQVASKTFLKDRIFYQ